MTTVDTFYETVPTTVEFAQLSGSAPYRAVPGDWIVGLADIVDSSQLIENGQYKTVNTVGAAIISASINALPDIAFPFMFGGDGAAFAVPAVHGEAVARTLDAVRRWARVNFDIELRTASLTVADIRAAGKDVLVARYAPNQSVTYAMFAGGGLTWAEREMKNGAFHVAELSDENMPDLTGLSCRWTPIRSNHGSVWSVVVAPRQDADAERVAQVMGDVFTVTRKLDRSGHPVSKSGPGFSWPPQGLELEARAGNHRKPLWQRKLKLYLETLIALVFFKTGWIVGGFDPKHYVRTSSENSDFRKFEDALMMTLDCDPASGERLLAILKNGEEQGLIRYGISEQEEALMTCIVPSVMTDDHIHFVDGASGGYAKAAERIKRMREVEIRTT